MGAVRANPSSKFSSALAQNRLWSVGPGRGSRSAPRSLRPHAPSPAHASDEHAERDSFFTLSGTLSSPPRSTFQKRSLQKTDARHSQSNEQ